MEGKREARPGAWNPHWIRVPPGCFPHLSLGHSVLCHPLPDRPSRAPLVGVTCRPCCSAGETEARAAWPRARTQLRVNVCLGGFAGICLHPGKRTPNPKYPPQVPPSPGSRGSGRRRRGPGGLQPGLEYQASSAPPGASASLCVARTTAPETRSPPALAGSVSCAAWAAGPEAETSASWRLRLALTSR